MEDLIKPAEALKYPTTASQGLIYKLKDMVPKPKDDGSVPPEDFLVSAMFCVFEAHDAMEEFRLTDKDGKDVIGKTRTAIITSITDYFSSKLPSNSICSFDMVLVLTVYT